MNKQELNKKLAEWAGFKRKEKHTIGMLTGHWHYVAPDGSNIIDIEMPDFTQSLDACFRWLVPKLVPFNADNGIDRIISFTYCEGGDVQCEIECGDGVAEWTDANPALALCLAIEKLIDSEK